WILLTLSPTLNLEINTLCVKVEATAADLVVILLALYKRAEDIPTTPLTRVSFHATVLLASTGGFRPGTLENTSCRQYTLSVVRDPADRAQRRIIVIPNFYDLWTRCLLVIGCRKSIRPYALCVSARARMDASLSSALRNYVMSHPGDILETEHQTGVVRANLAELAFGAKAVRRDEILFNDLRNMSLTRDEGAPISVSEERIAKFQERNDIAKFRAEIWASTDRKEKIKLYSQIRHTIRTCTKLQLEEDMKATSRRQTGCVSWVSSRSQRPARGVRVRRIR
ncbi:hypothetical protein C8A05DRAFT_39305, partial [Staphylotrichum tortipilum]